MAGKHLVLSAPGEALALLVEAIRLYALAAYPPGGSECAQVAREALLQAAGSIEQQIQAGGQVSCSRRLRSQLKAALNYYAEQNQLDSACLDLLLKLPGGTALSNELWAETNCVSASTKGRTLC